VPACRRNLTTLLLEVMFLGDACPSLGIVRRLKYVHLFTLGIRSKQLSLSRLNHWLPRGQTDAEVMQGTTDFHHEIADALLPQPDPVFDDATALDTAVHMLDPEPAVMQRLIGPFLLPGQLLASGFLGRHEDRHLRECERQEPQILQEPAPRR
jgi:hypothetical protein